MGFEFFLMPFLGPIADVGLNYATTMPFGDGKICDTTGRYRFGCDRACAGQAERARNLARDAALFLGEWTEAEPLAAFAKEIVDGRGPVYVDLRHVDDSYWNDIAKLH